MFLPIGDGSMGLVPRGTWRNYAPPPPPNEKGGHDWKIIGDPPWTVGNMAIQNKKDCEHHNGKMGKRCEQEMWQKKKDIENQKGKLEKMWEREKWEN